MAHSKQKMYDKYVMTNEVSDNICWLW